MSESGRQSGRQSGGHSGRVCVTLRKYRALEDAVARLIAELTEAEACVDLRSALFERTMGEVRSALGFDPAAYAEQARATTAAQRSRARQVAQAEGLSLNAVLYPGKRRAQEARRQAEEARPSRQLVSGPPPPPPTQKGT